MRGSFTVRIFMLLLALLLLCVGGVWASWIYCEEYADPSTDNLGGIGLSEFVWAPEEILPTDKPGENYLDLLESILNNSKGGLNSSKGTLENAVDKHQLVHSSQNVQGGNLKHLFIT